MDTYTVVQVQPNATVSTASRWLQIRPHVYATPGQARAFRTNAAKANNRRAGFRIDAYRILHTHIDLMTYEVTTDWID
ncbi:hypothetical protein Wildcat_83 [Mycobacterium phage Wildcat]|nr:hypothetical protein Wildcat_83 [Mycobacterium phage Wildcat]ABE67688.1 hypothetical protein Wildcat_83 [Mycobacterium phage Wildcat]QGJ89970.1 hypothetical protein PBI_MARYV_83 [Mycobacterium phage MaryV]